MVIGLQSAQDEGDAREIDGRLVAGEDLRERPGGQPRRADRVGVRARAQGEGHRQLVGADGGRGVPVRAAPELAAQAVVDDRATPLQSVQDLSGCVAALAAQRDARAVPRPRGLRW